MKCRTTFYKAITRLLVADLGEDEERFDTFMKPLKSLFVASKSPIDSWLCHLLFAGSFDKLEQLMMYDSLSTDKFKACHQ